MINLRSKIEIHGWSWLVRRILREILQPVTRVGKWLKPFSFLVYGVLCKPIDACNYLRLRSKKKSMNALYFFYDLEVEPITYNFCWALAIAEARRKKYQLSELKIIIVPGLSRGLRIEDPDYQAVVDDDARWWRIYSILLPMAMLLPNRPSIYFHASRQEALLWMKEQARYIYPDKYNVTFPTTHQMRDAMHFNEDFMAFQATPKASAYVSEWLKQHANNRKVIVITLRQYDYTIERNSNIDAWAAFAHKLDKEEFFIVIVPDTEKAFRGLPEPLQDFMSLEAACWNVGIRAALYELAYLNLGVNTGPMSLCWLNARCRYITFKMVTRGPSPASLEKMLENGFKPNEAPTFANPLQRWVWEDDEEKIISREFNVMCQRLENKNSRQEREPATIM